VHRFAHGSAGDRGAVSRTALAACLLALGLLGGCGGDDEPSAATSTAPPAATATTATGADIARFAASLSDACARARPAGQAPQPGGVTGLRAYAARQRAVASRILSELGAARPPAQAAAGLEALRSAYMALMPVYEQVAGAGSQAEVRRLSGPLRGAEQAARGAAVGLGVPACSPTP
jgi:hypothetical protein